MAYMTVGMILLLASAVAAAWTSRADRESENFARDNRCVMLAFAFVNVLAAAAIFATALSDA